MNIFASMFPTIDLNDFPKHIHRPDTKISKRARLLLHQQFGDAETGLGGLTPMFLRWLDITGELYPKAPQMATVICCADHGVAEEGVSAYPQKTTLEMAKNYTVRNGAAANVFSMYAGSSLLVADLGIAAAESDIPSLFPLRIAAGTKNMTKGPAMTREQAVASIKTGLVLAKFIIDNGCDWILPGEMGIANTTASAAIAAVCCGKTPEEVTGRGTNISDERLKKKINVVRRALEVNQPDPNDAIDILAKVGGFEFGCMAGLILGAAVSKKAVILDGANCAAAALLAQKIAPESISYVFASQLGSEKSHRYMLETLGLRPFLHLDLRLSETAGASIAALILKNFLAYWYISREKLPENIGCYDLCRVLQQGGFCELDPSTEGNDAEDDASISDIDDDLDEDNVEDALIDIFVMPDKDIQLTDKTFDFYLKSMPELDKDAMAACQDRLDHLTKPIDSLGCLEQIVCELAGCSGVKRPEQDTKCAMIIFTLREKLSPALSRMLQTSAAFTRCSINLEQIKTEQSIMAAFNFGREEAEVLAAIDPIVTLSIDEVSADDAPGTMDALIRQALLTDEGELRFTEDTFLKHVPAKYQHLLSALLGAIIAAAHNHSLILLDGETAKIIARYAVKMAPEIRSYLLPLQPDLLDLRLRLPGLAAACGIQIVKAALYMLDNMKTFEETKVSIASDGPGAIRQDAGREK